jgi:Protein of unknown function (DUF1488)
LPAGVLTLGVEQLERTVKTKLMQTLMALNELPKNYAGGVRFRMMNDLTRVICWVTREALDRAEDEKSSQLNQIPRFERHRIQIEQLASQKYDAGEQAPIVMSFDFVTVSPGDEANGRRPRPASKSSYDTNQSARSYLSTRGPPANRAADHDRCFRREIVTSAAIAIQALFWVDPVI